MSIEAWGASPGVAESAEGLLGRSTMLLLGAESYYAGCGGVGND